MLVDCAPWQDASFVRDVLVVGGADVEIGFVFGKEV